MNTSTHSNSPSVEPLFEPLRIGSLTLPNRIVMAPMTRSFSPNGVPGENVAEYYSRRAKNQVGLIITEGTVIDHPAASGDANVPYFYGEAALKGWAKTVEAVHQAGGIIFPQLWHVGTERKVGSEPNPASLPVGPSGVTAQGEKVNEPLSITEIQLIVEAYATAAAEAKRIGFDGIEIHGAHGYLIDQFFWEGTNKRTDEYGGDMIKRTRFAVEIIEACRKAVGPDYPIVLRISQWKSTDYTAKLAATPELLAEFLAPLSAAGVDVFHCSTRRFWEPEFEGSDLNLAGWVKKLTGKPSITVGSVGLSNEFTSLFTEGKGASHANLDELLERLEKQEFDLVAVGRALLNDPEWVTKVREQRFNELGEFQAESLRKLY
ncbi:2,4-dienoyl-CoA reductase-like NADH-dependent reductase (Old Yellow Enzyme family) [Paenibacillus shirakamiensis]|uniref:2,4-dienoyl-CoA reductase-like NADH-dependent reductase (Old Yellow Enzyme family) n=1 Tax=Paenibacillus shirakamiensis TaxID=1265935 RepID=A0ABS4JF29_9BACL|nr:NADH:flavin oxidoreductase [Paenibacillus shirakamiensis]MBP2000315.1 2,4-dienoyl-CoA reductase-like NADH-dependent reductase (Old Yellow Enzyme family) [Paenibacillus shirakamiensis]